MKLIITEKPSVAGSIAKVLGADLARDGYMEGNGYVVSHCLGHLVELSEPEAYKEEWKKWSYESLPIFPKDFKYRIKEETKGQYKVLKELMGNPKVTSVVNACDAGREGELIFRLVYDMAGCQKPMERLWISSMEEEAIREGMNNLKPGSMYEGLYHAALLRMQADWLVGLNGTRLFTVMYGGKTLKVGRVQSPTLSMLVKREEEIKNFKKETYYRVHLICKKMEAVTERIESLGRAEEIARACQNKEASVLSLTREEKQTAPPRLYDLTTLQRDANRLFGYTAKQTLDALQSLYEKKLATYPRTDSQYLSDDMGQTAGEVIQAVLDSGILPGAENNVCKPDIQRVLNSKKVTDHHAIIPTVEVVTEDLSSLIPREGRILAMIASRLLCATGETYVYETVKAELNCGGSKFYVTGKNVLAFGFKKQEEDFRHLFRGAKEEEEKSLPELREGQVFLKTDVKVREHETRTLKGYTEDSLLSAMEHAGDKEITEDAERWGIGTPATRADIIEKLVSDGYVMREKKQLIPTKDGINLIFVLPESVKSPKLTADWENALALIAKGEGREEDFMGGIRRIISDFMDAYHKPGEEEKRMFEKDPEVMGMCPICGRDVVNLKGKKGKEGYDYFKCQNRECSFRMYRDSGRLYKLLQRKITDKDMKSLLLPCGLTAQCVSARTGKKYKANIKPKNELQEFNGKLYPDFDLILL